MDESRIFLVPNERQVRVLIFGAGLLGKELYEGLSGTQAEFVGREGVDVDVAKGCLPPGHVKLVSRSECDIQNLREVDGYVGRGRKNEGDELVVINAAAYTDVDKAENEPREAFATNALGARNVARAAWVNGAGLVHISTNAVFDGANGEFDETSAPKAASVYGYTKLIGEEFVREACTYSVIADGLVGRRSWHIVRTGFLYGKHGRNFGSTLFSRMRAGEKVPADPVRLVTPTWARPVAQAIKAMIEKRVPSGVYHAISDMPMSWHRFGLIARQQIPKGDVESVPGPVLAPRPKESIMISRKLQMFDIHMPTVAGGMAQAIEAGV